MAKRGPKPHPNLLTPRESEVLALIRDGLTNAQIAAHLNISPETAKYHVSEILSKLNVPTREAAAAWQPAARPFSLGRALLAAASLGTLAAVIAGLALLSWGLSRSGTGSDALESPTAAAAAPTRQPTSSPAPTPTFNPRPTPPTPGATVVPVSPPNAVADYRLVLLRPGYKLISGQLFLANADGSNPTPLTDETRLAQFLGIFDASRIYYSERIADEESVIYRLDIASGESTELLRHPVRQFYSDRAAISPDEQSIAFTNYTSIDLYDLETGETRRLLHGEEGGPCADVYPGCHGYARPSWSADGSLLLAHEEFSEGAAPVIIDPSGPVEPPIKPVGEANAAFWSTSGSALCSFGRNYSASPVYVSSAPDWQPTEYLADLVAANIGARGCALLSDDRMIVTTDVHHLGLRYDESRFGFSTISVVDPVTGTHTEVATVPSPETAAQIGAFTVIDDQYLLTNFLLNTESGDTFGRPAYIDLNTGAVHPIDAAGYVVVAAIPPN